MKMCEKENLSEPKIVQQTDVTAAFCSLSPWRIRRIKTWSRDIAKKERSDIAQKNYIAQKSKYIANIIVQKMILHK